jgi:putative ABC transport system permease protein
VSKAQYVVVLGESINKSVFKGEKAIGKMITLWGIPFTVIGVLKDSAGSGGAGWLSQKAMIPYTTMIQIKGNLDVGMFSAMPKKVSEALMVKQGVKNYLANLLHYNPADTGALNSPDLTKLMRYFTIFFLAIEVFLGFCGLLTLIVGGISVANMMFLMVTERTREIGLRMALGAKRKNILFLVLLETFLIVALGGFAGIVFSKAVVLIFDNVALPSWLGQPHIHSWTMMITVLILFLVTFLAGIFPARSASRMQPVDALSF